MTVPSLVDSNEYVATGTNSVYAFTFRALNISDILVQLMDTAGNITTLTYLTNYTIVGIGQYTGGFVSLTAGNLTIGWTIIIFRDPALYQNTSLQTQGAYSAKSVETALDLLTMDVQALNTRRLHTVTAPLFDTANLQLPSAQVRANGIFGFDSSGNAEILTTPIPTTNVPVAGLDQIIDTIAALKALTPPASAMTYLVRGYYSIADGGEGQFYWNAGSSAADNGGTIIVPNVGGVGRWIRLCTEGVANIRQFGAKGDGATNDSPSIIAAMTWLGAPGGVLYFPPSSSSYLMGTAILYTVPAAGGTGPARLLISGYGATIKSTIGELTAGYGRPVFGFIGSSEESSLEVEGMRFDGNSAGTNGDAIWFNGKGSLVRVEDCSFEKFRHHLVECDYTGSSGQLLAIGRFLNNQHDLSTNTSVIISASDAPLIQGCRFRFSSSWALEIGQFGDRSFAGTALTGAVNVGNVVSNLVERNNGGFLAVNARGVTWKCNSFEDNNGGGGPPTRYHLDLTGSTTTGAGDWFAILEQNDFASAANDGWNIRTRDGTRSHGNVHKDGNPCIEHIGPLEPLYCPFEIFQQGMVVAKFKAGGIFPGVIDELDIQHVSSTGSIANGIVGQQASPGFLLDTCSLLVLTSWVTDAAGATNAGYEFVLRNMTDGAVATTIGTQATKFEPGTGGNNQWMRRVRLIDPTTLPGHNAGDIYAFFLRNNSGAGPVTIFGSIAFRFCQYTPTTP